MKFVVCERSWFTTLCSRPECGMELVAEEVEIQGYRIAVLKEWALNRARYIPYQSCIIICLLGLGERIDLLHVYVQYAIVCIYIHV